VGPIAQSVEQRTFNPWVDGSSPSGPTDSAFKAIKYERLASIRLNSLLCLRIMTQEVCSSMFEKSADVIVFGYGLITKQIIDNLLAHGYYIICVTDLKEMNNRALNDKGIEFITRSEATQNKLRATAAIFTWKNCEPLIEQDLRILNWLSSELLEVRASFLLSSGSVYVDSAKPQTEETNELLSNVLNNEKYKLEIEITKLMESKRVRHSNLRISNVYGGDLTYGFIAHLVDSWRKKTPPRVFRDQSIVRDYLFIEDLIFAIHQLLEAESLGRNINISTGIGTEISQVLHLFEKNGFIFRKTVEIENPTTQSSILDCTLLSNNISWKPKNLSQGIGVIAELL
jgi:UDP-glucose 4-epimerase